MNIDKYIRINGALLNGTLIKSVTLTRRTRTDMKWHT